MNRPKPFAMIREFHLADWFTLGNAVCGVGSIFSTMTYVLEHDTTHIYYAAALVFAALVFDIFSRSDSSDSRKVRTGIAISSCTLPVMR